MSDAPPIEGPYFVFESAPGLFLGREGAGPLEVVWDTNVLIDYLQHGAALWEDESPDIADEEYRAQVEALGLIVNVWTRRDVRFHVLERSVTDAKRRLTDERERTRRRAMSEIAAALRLDMWADERPENSMLEPSAEAASRGVPAGADRELVEESLRLGSHVFLTRDEGILACGGQLRPHGLLVASPLDLLEELAACGALLCVTHPRTMTWPVPDLQRLAHLVQALGRL